MSYKVLKRSFPVIERECPQCGAKMRSTGQLVHGPAGWSILFLCAPEKLYVPIMQWPEDRELLGRETDGVDPSLLPSWPTANAADPSYELFEQLGREGWYIHSWRARLTGADPIGEMLVVRSFGLSTCDDQGQRAELRPEVERLLPKLQQDAGLWGRGLVPGRFILHEKSLIFERPFLPERLAERFPPSPSEPPHGELLAALEDIAEGLDLLSSRFDSLPFLKLSNLFWTGGAGVLVDSCLDSVTHLVEESYAGPRLGTTFGGIGNWADLQPIEWIRKVTDLRSPAAALAGAYFALRVGRGLFAPPGDPARWSSDSAKSAYQAAKNFLNTGHPPLDGLPDERERDLLMGALARPPERRFRSARELAGALRAIHNPPGRVGTGGGSRGREKALREGAPLLESPRDRGGVISGAPSSQRSSPDGQERPTVEKPPPRYFVQSGADATPRAVYRIGRLLGFAEHWTSDGWRENEDVMRRYWNGFDADVDEVSEDDAAEAIGAIEVRRAAKSAAAAGQSAGSGPQPLPILVVATGVPPRTRFLAVVSPDGRPARGVIPPVEILGEFRCVDGKPDMSEVSFVPNEKFVAFLHETIAQRGAAPPGLVRAASIQAEGWLYILDGRTPTPQGEVPQRDIVSAFEVREGKIVPGSYWRNPEHLLYSKAGFFMLAAGLRECVLRELARRRAVIEMQAARWTLRGYDSFAHEHYPLAGAFDTEDDAIAAARTYLAELASAQPSASSGGQDGIQDRVFIIRPDGSTFRVTG